jgi:uncharacterized repeat protein (TIGR03837 family)
MQWDIFCRVIDNLGDIGVCWRLCADLASRGQRVRLWIDLPDDLEWMVPGARQGLIPGVEVIHWTEPMRDQRDWLAADVWIEAFGCDPASECRAALARRVGQGGRPPVWLNLEYMSAESYVERCHRLPSPIMAGPLQGLTKWFFYPGFTQATGGLLREDDLLERQAAHSTPVWLDGLDLPLRHGRRISLFCYAPAVLPQLLRETGDDPAAEADWLITAGWASDSVRAAVQTHGSPGPHCHRHQLPRLTQRDYDHLLWSCDLNFVRGEDSLVRAIWAGKPFVWHIYPQHDNAHHAKLEAFLDWLDAPDSMRRFHRVWNGIEQAETLWPGWAALEEWAHCIRNARSALLSARSLGFQLMDCVAEKHALVRSPAD